MTNIASSLPSTSTRSQFFDGQTHQRRTCEGYFQNSSKPISYLGDIWELYVLGLKTKVFCENNNKILKAMDKGLTEPKWVL